MVIIALLLVALLAILALAIDGGLTYTQRRRAQNAADAGALAGARAMCTTGAGDPVVEAREYAGRNGVDNVASNVVVSAIQSGVVRSVVVSVTMPYDTFFAGILGISNTQVGAVAEAACYPPCSGAGLLPVAWSCRPPSAGGEPSVSPTCDVQVSRDLNGIPIDRCSLALGDPVYVVVDSDQLEDEIVCQDPADPPDYSDNLVDCDTDDDGINDLQILSGGSRAWLDLDGGTGAINDEWILNGFPGTLLPHTWFPGQTGVVQSLYQDIKTLEGKTVTIPVFDEIFVGNNPPATHTSGPYNGITDIIVPSSAASSNYFHVMTFATFEISCADPSNFSGSCPAKDVLVNEGVIKANISTVEGCFKQGIFESTGYPGQCNVDAGAYVLKLIR